MAGTVVAELVDTLGAAVGDGVLEGPVDEGDWAAAVIAVARIKNVGKKLRMLTNGKEKDLKLLTP